MECAVLSCAAYCVRANPPPPRAAPRRAGLIDYTEFCEILQVDASPQVERLFQMFDKDKSGQIDVKEFLIGLSNFTGAGKEEKLKFAFMVFDEDGNGVITKQELLKILKANHMASSDSEVIRKAETIMMQVRVWGGAVMTCAVAQACEDVMERRAGRTCVRVCCGCRWTRGEGWTTSSLACLSKFDVLRALYGLPRYVWQADKDGDGVISFDEFVVVSKKFPNILFPAYSLGQRVTDKLGPS